MGDGGDAVLNDAYGPVVKEGSIEQLSEIEYAAFARASTAMNPMLWRVS